MAILFILSYKLLSYKKKLVLLDRPKPSKKRESFRYLFQKLKNVYKWFCTRNSRKKSKIQNIKKLRMFMKLLVIEFAEKFYECPVLET